MSKVILLTPAFLLLIVEANSTSFFVVMLSPSTPLQSGSQTAPTGLKPEPNDLLSTRKLTAFIVGGAQGAAIATFAWKQVVPTSIQIATMGVIVGFVIFYVKGEHTLRI